LVGDAVWDKICHEMELLFRRGEFEAGVLHGITKISAELEHHFPSNGQHHNEIPNYPIVL
jgi:uncharacterized membrane protein